MNKLETEIIQYPIGNTQTSYTIPSSVETIRNGAFINCYNLQSIEVDLTNNNFSSDDGILFNKNEIEIIQYPIGKIQQSYTIPDNTKIIREGAFQYSLLQSITVTESTTQIENYSFANNQNLNCNYKRRNY